MKSLSKASLRFTLSPETFERKLVGNIITDDGGGGMTVIHATHGLEALAARRVPNTQSDASPVHVDLPSTEGSSCNGQK